MTPSSLQRIALVGLLSLGASACGLGNRVLVVTATKIGFHATPGDAQAQPPQVTLAYKRSETAVLPTESGTANDQKDAFSVLATFDFMTNWFSNTELTSTIATGLAAQNVAAGVAPSAPSAPAAPAAPAGGGS